jgi:DNA phosphorothioation-dependent restriction protein DptG
VRMRYILYGVVLASCGLLSYMLTADSNANGVLWHIAPFYGSVLLTVGWVVSAELNVKNSKRQHTIVLITQHTSDRQRIENRDVILKYLPSYKDKFTEDLVSFGNETHELTKAIDLELNFYEFLAAAVLRDDVDEDLLVETLRTKFLKFFEQNQDYIAHWQKDGGTTWIHITDMYRRWSKLSIHTRR